MGSHNQDMSDMGVHPGLNVRRPERVPHAPNKIDLDPVKVIASHHLAFCSQS